MILNKVIGSAIVYIIFYAILFSLIFWILTFIFKYYYSNKNFDYKLNYYECGFKSTTNIRVQYDINFVLIMLFLIIYDGEFLLIIPFSLNLLNLNYISLVLLIMFTLLLLITVMYDLIYNSLEWQI